MEKSDNNVLTKEEIESRMAELSQELEVLRKEMILVTTEIQEMTHTLSLSNQKVVYVSQNLDAKIVEFTRLQLELNALK